MEPNIALRSNKIASAYRIDQPNAQVGWEDTIFGSIILRQNERTKKVAALAVNAEKFMHCTLAQSEDL